MTASKSAKDAVHRWLALLCMTYALAFPQILSLTPRALNDERLAPIAAQLVVSLGLSSTVAKISAQQSFIQAPETPQQINLALANLLVTIIFACYLHLKLSLLQDERNCLQALQEEKEKTESAHRQRELEVQAQRAKWVEKEKARLRQMEDDWRQQVEKAEKKMDEDWQAQTEAVWRQPVEEVPDKQMDAAFGEQRITVQLEVELSNQPILLTQEVSVPINRSMAVLRRDRNTREVLKRINEADHLSCLFQSDQQTVMADNACLPPAVILERSASGRRAISLGGQ